MWPGIIVVFFILSHCPIRCDSWQIQSPTGRIHCQNSWQILMTKTQTAMIQSQMAKMGQTAMTRSQMANFPIAMMQKAKIHYSHSHYSHSHYSHYSSRIQMALLLQ